TLRFSARDTGIGLAEDQIGRLFNPFSQADQSTTRKYGGTGLGLAICKQLVEMMGGKISVESIPGRGSLFRFTVKLGIGVADAVSFRPSVKGARVLVVDDSAAARQVYGDILHSMSFAPWAVASAKEALLALEQERFDVVLMDWKMPEMDGIEATRRIRTLPECSRLPIILMTAHGREDLVEAAVAAGATHYLEKPVKPSLLLETLYEALESGEQVSRPAREKLDQTDAARQLGGARVLLVEDNALNRRLAGEILGDAGVHVEIAEHGAEAVAAVQRSAYDVVLMDVQMPVMDGYEATRAIRALPQFAQLPIIAMTANAMERDQQECRAAGMNDFLSKPIDSDQLLVTLAKWMQVIRATPPKEAAPVPQTLTDRLPDSLPGIDCKGSLRRLGGREALLRELLQELVIEQAHASKKIDEAWQRGDKTEAVRLAHSLKGVAANLGCTRLAETAGELEQSCKQGRAENLPAQLAAVQAAFEEVQASVTGLATTAMPPPDHLRKSSPRG
ncbi:MAG: response regulator, partial [Nevskiales bacterium]